MDIRSTGIKLVHVPGIFNILADELSRKDVERIEAPVFTLEDLEDNVLWYAIFTDKLPSS